jgi:hypothetical protein
MVRMVKDGLQGHHQDVQRGVAAFGGSHTHQVKQSIQYTGKSQGITGEIKLANASLVEYLFKTKPEQASPKVKKPNEATAANNSGRNEKSDAEQSFCFGVRDKTCGPDSRSTWVQPTSQFAY